MSQYKGKRQDKPETEWCQTCRDYQQAGQRKRRKKNGSVPARRPKSVQGYKGHKATFVDAFKALEGCYFCEERNPTVLVFHHLPEYHKVAGVSEMVQNGYSHEEILSEVGKCIVLCCNDHALLHAGEVALPEDYLPTTQRAFFATEYKSEEIYEEAQE
jgi:hypothetical protein